MERRDKHNYYLDIAATVLERDIKKEEHSEMIDSFIDKLGDDND